MERREAEGYILLLLAGICWGTSGIFVNQLTALGLSTGMICCGRVLPAFLMLFLIALGSSRRELFQIDRRSLLFCALTGIVCQGLFNLLYTAAIRTIGLSMSAVIMYLAPVITAFVSAYAFKEKITNRKRFALFVNILGCALTVTGGQITGLSLPVAGLLFGLGSALCYAMAAVFGRLAASSVKPLVSAVWTFFFAALFMVLAVHPVAAVRALSWQALPGILGYAAVPTVLAYILYFAGLRRVRETSRVPVLTSLEPVTACLIGILVYREPIHLANGIGILLVLASLVLISLQKSPSCCRRSEREFVGGRETSLL